MILLLSGICYAQTEQGAMTTDGRQIILKPDKTWVYLDEQDSNTQPSTLIVGDNVSEVRKLVDPLGADLAQNTSEGNAEFGVRLKRVLGEKRLAKSDHSLYRSVLVADKLDLEYDSYRGHFELMPIDLRITASDGSNPEHVLLVQNDGGKWIRRNGFSAIRFPMSSETAATMRPYLRLAVYGFPVQVSDGKLFFVPTRYVIFNAKTGKRYVDFVEANLLNPR